MTLASSLRRRPLRSALSFGFGLLLAACAGSAWAQPPAPPPSAPSTAAPAKAAASKAEYLLGPGDIIKITVFQNPDLSIETRVSENGTITFPLIGQVQVVGVSPAGAEARIAHLLKEGAFLVDPQVTVLVEQVHGNQVAALGQFNRPGRYPLETAQMRLSDLIATAGGIAATGSDSVILTGQREGKPYWKQVDVGSMFVRNQMQDDVYLEAGDVLFVDRQPLFYIYGEVQRPGSYRVERGMTVVQALATGGGLTLRGTKRGLLLKRKDGKGQVADLQAELDDPVQAEDVIYVRESIF